MAATMAMGARLIPLKSAVPLHHNGTAGYGFFKSQQSLAIESFINIRALA